MIVRFASVAVAAVLVAFAHAASPARAASGVERISGSAFETLAKPVAHAVRLTGDSALIPAFAIPDQSVPAGKVLLLPQPAISTPSYVNVPIEIDLNGRYLRTVFVGYRVQQYVKTAVATHDLVPGTVLSAGDIAIERVPFSGQHSNGAQALVGRKIVAAFRAGNPVFIEQTQTNEIVKPGASVVLIVRDSGVSVVADVVARTGGGLGDEVNIYNPQTNKMLTGTVIGPDRVELNLSGDAQ